MSYVNYNVYHIHLVNGLMIKMIQWEELPSHKTFAAAYRKAAPDDILQIGDFNGNIHMVLRKNIVDVVRMYEPYEGPRPDFLEKMFSPA